MNFFKIIFTHNTITNKIMVLETDQSNRFKKQTDRWKNFNNIDVECMWTEWINPFLIYIFTHHGPPRKLDSILSSHLMVK